MKAEQLAVVQGWDDTRATLLRWNAPTLARAAGRGRSARSRVTALLLTLTWVVAAAAVADPLLYDYPGVTRPAEFGDFGYLLYRNGLVLALHALACVAGFIAGSQLPTAAQDYSGVVRKLHDKAGSAAMAFVALATLFSLGTQAYALGNMAAGLGRPARSLAAAVARHAAPARAARAVRALPAAGRLVTRQHPRRVEGAARGDVRDDRHRGAAAGARRRRRDLGHAEPAGRRFRVGSARYTF